VSFIQVSERGIKIVQRDLKRMQGKYKSAIRLAIKTTLRDGKVIVARAIYKELVLPIARIKKGLRTAIFNDQGAILAQQRGVLLSRYGARILKSGIISVRVKRSGGRRKKVRGGFFVPLRAGSRVVQGIAIPHPKGGTFKSGRPRFKVLYGPSVDQAMQTLRPQIEPKIADKFESELTRQIKRIIKS